ncbi:MAG: GGDEF domain-containing protein, partial [Campylobacter sp.]|nr:GGDEF domain-containing protein [Campylobacter sp.]
MLYSEKKERSNRFKLALKVAFPFTLVLIFVAYFMFKEGDFTRDDVILFVILLLCYVYYATYLIYMGFKKSLIDPVSRVFVRDEILKIIAKDIKKEKVNNIVLMRIKNIIDINDRYGYRNGDEILRLFVVEFDKFMQDHKFKDIPIGRFINGNFIFAIDGKRANLHHILNMFERKIANQTINNIELKMEYATINADYDKNLNNVINALFYKINHKDDEELDFDKIEIGTFENDVLEAINNEQYSIKYQLMKSVNGEDEYLNFIPKIDLK